VPVQNVLIFMIVCLAYFFVSYKLYKRHQESQFGFLLGIISVVHIIALILHYKWSLNLNSDAIKFYQNASNASNWIETFGTGNKSISFFIYPFVRMGLSYFSLSAIFSFIGLVGYYIYLDIGISTFKKVKRVKFLITILLLIPSFHFWTAALTKEAIIFTLMAMLFKMIDSKNINYFKVLIILLTILLIRPYISVFLLLSIIIINYKKYKLLVKISLCLFFIASGFVLLKFLNINSLESIKNNYYYLAEYAKNNGGSSIDLLESNYFERMFLTLFRPLFFDANSLIQHMVSIENLIWFICVVLFLSKIRHISFMIKIERFLIIFIVFTIVFYSIYMYNLGLANRMRVMFYPYFSILLLLLYQKATSTLEKK